MGLAEFREQGLSGLQHNFITGKLEDLVGWARARSSWPATFGLACCAIEMMGTGASHYDLARFGMEVFRASPRQADILIVSGRVSQKMAPPLRQTYDQMMDPKWVISMGVCASTGGMFNNYAIVQGVDQIVPVDVYAPGCPPTPETLIHAITTLHRMVENGEILARRADAGGGAGVHVDEQPSTGEPVILEHPTAPAMSESPTLYGCAVSESYGQTIVHPSRAQYIDLMKALVDDGFQLCVDLTAVDYLTHPGRSLPEGVEPERFEVVLAVLDIDTARRLRVRVQVPADDSVLPTLFDVWPGTEALEREVFDMFGIRFDGHPDLSRILMPEDWIGHPLRKDYEVGDIPVQFKEADRS